jgi:hypothetical protein
VKLTPTQFFAAACTPVQQALALAPSFSLTLPASVEADVQKATPMVNAACAAGATVSITNVQDFATTVLPAANAVIQAAPAGLISDADKQRIGGGIALAILAVDTVVAVAQNAAAAAGASGANTPPPAAPAVPAPASGTLVA